jgi:hypothetical protein
MALDAQFWPSLWKLAAAAKTRPEVFLTVWFAESGLSPSARNPKTGSIGLNQTCPSEIGGPGFPSTAEAFQAASASEQLAWIAPQVLAQVRLNGGGFRSAARYQQANWLPKTLETAKAPGDVIAGELGPYTSAYRDNASFDVHKRGVVTLADLGDYLEHVVTTRGMDVDQGAPLEAAIHAAYAPANRPTWAPWDAPRLPIHEPVTRPARRNGGGILVALAGLFGIVALARATGGRA